MLKLQVFSGKTFAESQEAFNNWIAEHKGCGLANPLFMNSERASEILVLWTEEPPQDSRIARPDLHFGGRPQ